MNIRQATSEDKNQLKRLYDLHYSNEEKEIETISFEHSNFINILFIAEEDDKLIGFIWGYFIALGIRRYGYVEDLFIEQNKRNKGVATALLKALKMEFLKLKVEAVFVTTEKNNDEAIKLYSKEGFSLCPGPWFFWTPKD